MERTNETGPILFMANHQLVHRTGYGILELSRERKNLTVACDAAFSSLMAKVGLEVIPIDSPNKISWTSSKVDKARVWLTRTWGNMIHAYDNALSGQDAVEAMVETLKQGRDLFICPSGVSNPKAQWRSGVGKVAIGVREESVRAGFVYVPNSFFRGNRVKVGPTVGSLIPDQEGNVSPKALALTLQAQYNQLMLGN